MSEATRAFVLMAVIVGVRWFALEATFESARAKHGALIFRGSLGIRLLVAFTTPFFLYGAISVYMSHGDWWLSLTLLGGAIGGIVLWPSDIEVSDSGIAVRRYFGFRRKMYGWSQNLSADESPAENCVEVTTDSGYTIKHTPYHVDRAGFLNALKKHHVAMF